MRVAFTGLLAALSLCHAATAAAGVLTDPVEGGPETPFHIIPAWDFGLIALDLGITNGLKHIVDHPHTDGERGDLWALDAPVVGWGTHDDAMRSSDIGAMMAVAFATVDSAVSAKHDGWRSGAVKFTLYAESALTTAALTEIVKQTVQRPRPCSYQPERRYREGLSCSPTDDDAYLSFFSGHTATTAALSATATYMAFREDDGGSRGAFTLAGGLALTGFVAAERMRAGKHFPTDVLTGAAVGAAVGVLVPHLHHVSRDAKGSAGTGTGTGSAMLASDGHMIGVAGVF